MDLADLVVGSVEDLGDSVVEVLAVAVEALVEAEPQGGGRISFSYNLNQFISIEAVIWGIIILWYIEFIWFPTSVQNKFLDST